MARVGEVKLAGSHQYTRGSIMVVECGFGPVTISPHARLKQSGLYVRPKLKSKNHIKRPARQPHERLTEIEFRVFVALGTGKRRKDIAAELHREVRTIAYTRRHILDKMQMQNNAQIVKYCVVHDMV